MIVSSQRMSMSVPMPDSLTVDTSNVKFLSLSNSSVTLDMHLTMKNQVVI